VRGFGGFHEEVDAVFETALATLRRAGAVIVDPVVLPHAGDYGEDELNVLLYEFKDGVNRYLATRPQAPKDLAALIAFNSANAGTELKYFRQELFERAQALGPLTDAAYVEARARSLRLAGEEGIAAALAAEKLDVLVGPTMGPAWLTDPVLGDHFVGGGASAAPAVAGYPHITVPMGQVDGLPVGLSLIGAPWSEGRLLGYAFAFERAAGQVR
jgi:amidase